MTQFKIVGVWRTRNGNLDLFGDSDNQGSFEEYLLEYQVNRYQKIRAWLGMDTFIGDFKANNPGSYFEHYFLFWCQVHRKYIVSYFRGEDRRLNCPECTAKFLSDINTITQTEISGKKNRRLRLVKSDKGLKS